MIWGFYCRLLGCCSCVLWLYTNLSDEHAASICRYVYFRYQDKELGNSFRSVWCDTMMHTAICSLSTVVLSPGNHTRVNNVEWGECLRYGLYNRWFEYWRGQRLAIKARQVSCLVDISVSFPVVKRQGNKVALNFVPRMHADIHSLHTSSWRGV